MLYSVSGSGQSILDVVKVYRTCSPEKHTASGALIGLRYPDEFHERIIDPGKDLTRFALPVVYRVKCGKRKKETVRRHHSQIHE